MTNQVVFRVLHEYRVQGRKKNQKAYPANTKNIQQTYPLDFFLGGAFAETYVPDRIKDLCHCAKDSRNFSIQTPMSDFVVECPKWNTDVHSLKND